MVVILFGVSGAGKTTLGRSLAEELGWKFYEGDDFHSPASIEKMRAGVALTDEDRHPWLDSLRELIERCLTTHENAVLSCSALKRSYRRDMRVNDAVKFVYLHGSYQLIAGRLHGRRGHFMNQKLLQSQFDTLEEPEPSEGVIVIELGDPPRELVREIKLRLDCGRKG